MAALFHRNTFANTDYCRLVWEAILKHNKLFWFIPEICNINKETALNGQPYCNVNAAPARQTS